MTDEEKRRAALVAGRRKYKVGYGKPPEHSRYKKGQSGNPNGRPKGARTRPPDHDRLAGIFLEEAYREIALRDGEREVRVPMARAVVRALLVKGARGTARAAQVALELLREIESRKREDHHAFLETVINYKTEWDAEIAARKRRGEPEPELDIHPDQISIDVAAGEVHFTGPLTKEDRRLQEELIERRLEFTASISRLRRELEHAEELEDAEMIREEIAHGERMLKIIRTALPEEEPIDAFTMRVERDLPTEE